MQEAFDVAIGVKGSFKIGRSPHCNVILDDSHVSKVHCSLNVINNSSPKGCQVAITDHSSNGTWLASRKGDQLKKLENGKLTCLQDGDIILLTRATPLTPQVIGYEFLMSPFPRIAACRYNAENVTDTESRRLKAKSTEKSVSGRYDNKEHDLNTKDCDIGTTRLKVNGSCKEPIADEQIVQSNLSYTENEESTGILERTREAKLQTGEGKSTECRFELGKSCKEEIQIERNKEPADNRFPLSPVLKRTSEGFQKAVECKKVRFEIPPEIRNDSQTTSVSNSEVNDQEMIKSKNVTEHLDEKPHVCVPEYKDESLNHITGDSFTVQLPKTALHQERAANGFPTLASPSKSSPPIHLSGQPLDSTETTQRKGRLPALVIASDIRPLHPVKNDGGPVECRSKCGQCAHCKKWIPLVTLSLHEAVCEGHSLEVNSQDHVALSSSPHEASSNRDDSLESEHAVSFPTRDKIEDATLPTSHDLPNISDQNVIALDVVSGGIDVEATCMPTTRDPKSDINEQDVDMSDSGEQDVQILDSTPKDAFDHVGERKLVKEVSLERCTYCSKLFPVSELVLHVAECSTKCAVAAAAAEEWSSDDDDYVNEACPHCGKYFEVVSLIEHVEHCRSDLMSKGRTSFLDRDTLGLPHTVEGTHNGDSASDNVINSLEADLDKSSRPDRILRSTCDEGTSDVTVIVDCPTCGKRLSVSKVADHFSECKANCGAASAGIETTTRGTNGITPAGNTAGIENLSRRTTQDIQESQSYSMAKGKDDLKGSSAPLSCSEVCVESDECRGTLKRLTSSLDCYTDCEEQCVFCLKMFAISVLVEHASSCALTKPKEFPSDDMEQCFHCLENFPLSELIDHAQNCDKRLVPNTQGDESQGAVTNSQSLCGEPLERCMYCFRDFPVSKLINHSQRCDGDMSGPRERFAGFLPSVHDLSAVSSVAILNDIQRAALDYVITRSAQDSKKVYPALLGRVTSLGYSENDLTKTLQWVRSASPIIIHINLDRVLNFLINDTHYRNRFETGTSGGSLDTTMRKSWEDRIFNKFYNGSNPSERVKYGVLNIVGDPHGVRSCLHYGDSFLQLKKVRLRTTFASMDTSGSDVKLSCCEHYGNVLYEYTPREIAAIMDVATGKVPFHRSDCISNYKEVQIHGPVSLSENVECIVVNSRHQRNKDIITKLDRFVEQNNCNLIWMDPDNAVDLVPSALGAGGFYSHLW